MKKYIWNKYALVIVLLLLIAVPIILSLPATKQYAAQYIAKEITNSLGNYVDLKDVEIKSLNSAAVKNLVVKDKEQKVFLQAKELDITVSWWALARGQELGGIKNITLVAPEINLYKRANGQWNYQDFIKEEPQSSKPKFQGAVKITQGQLQVAMDGQKIKLNNIEATGDLADMDNIPVVMEAQINNGHILVNGTVGNKANTALNLEGSNFDLMDYLAFLPKEYQKLAKVQSGKLSNFKLYVTTKDQIQIRGYGKFTDLAVVYGAYSLKNGEALINFQNQALRFFAKGQLNDSQVKAFGTVENYLQEPKVAGEIFADHFAYEGYKLSNIKAVINYAQDQIFLDKAVADFANGQIKAQGYYNLNTKLYAGDVQTVGLALGQVVPDIQGSLEARAVVKGQGTDLSQLQMTVDGKVAQGSYEGIAWRNMSFSLIKNGDNYTLSALNGELASGGSITAKGQMLAGAIKGEVFGTKIDLGLVNRYLPQLKLQGLGQLYATVAGSLDNPQAQVIFDGSKGSIMDRKFDDLRYRGTISKKEISIDQASLSVDNRPIYQGTGKIDLQTKALDLKLTTDTGRIENILRAAQVNIPLTGNFDNQVIIKGTMDNPMVKGNFKLWDGGYEGVLLQEVVGTYELQDGILELPNVEFLTPFVKGNVAGTITDFKDFDLAINANNINMSRLPIKYPYPITGMLDFEGHLAGNINYPIFTGKVHGDKIVFNNQPLEAIDAEVGFRDNLLQVNNFNFKMGEGSFNLNGKYNIDNQWLFVVANAYQVDSKGVLAMANVRTDILHGAFDGVAEITGTLKDPKIHVAGNMPKGYLKNFPLQNITLEMDYADQDLKLNKFLGQQNNGKVGAVGEINFRTKKVEGQLSANNVDPNIFVGLAGYDFNIPGSINGDLQVKGTLDKPEANFSVYVQGNGKMYDQGYVLGNLKNNIIYINQGVLSRGKSAIKTYGTIPLAAFSAKHRAGNLQDQMNMKVYLENTDLDILPNFFPEVQWATGQVKGNVNISGTVAKPFLSGGISTEKAAIKLKSLSLPFTDINGGITFQDESVKVENITAYLGNGYLSLKGFLNANGMGISNYQGRLIARELEVDSPYYKGHLNGDVSIAPMEYRGTKIPKLSVNLAFNNVMVAMPPLPESTDEPLPLMGLDINVVVGNNVRAYNPLLYDLYLNGGFNIKGTTRNPQSNGEVVVTNGTINVLKNIFKVNVGSIKFNQFNSYFPTLDFKASTKVGSNDIFVSLTGPVDKDLNTRLYSDPPMSEAEILKILAFRTDPNGQENGNFTQADVLSLATMGLQMSFLNEVEGNLRNLLHLDEFRISRDTLSEVNRQKFEANTNEVYNIQIGKYISNKLLLKYTHGINYDLNKFGIQYDINKHIGILGEYDRHNGYDVKVEMHWKF